MDLKDAAVVVSVAVGVLGIVGTVSGYGLFPVTSSHLDNRLRPVTYQLLLVRRHLNAVDLYQWQHDNPGPSVPRGAQEAIDQLKNKIVELDKQIAAMESQ